MTARPMTERERVKIAETLLKTTERMANSCSASMSLWNEHSNACLQAADALLSSSSAERGMREALEKISAEQWKDRSTISPMNAWEAAQKLNRHIVELYAIADAALSKAGV